MNATFSPGLRSQLLQYALNPLVKPVIEGINLPDLQDTKPPEPSHGGGIVTSTPENETEVCNLCGRRNCEHCPCR